MLGLRQKLTLGFGGLLAFLLVVGTLSILLLNSYSTTLEKIFRENYDSVVYGQRMKDAVDKLDDMAQRMLRGESRIDRTAYDAAAGTFEKNLGGELGNITLPGEGDVANHIKSDWAVYQHGYAQLLSATVPTPELRQQYVSTLYPVEQALKTGSQKVIDMNLANMVSVDGQVKESTVAARRMLIVLLTSGVILAFLFTAITARSILRPLSALIESAREIERGNLDLTVSVTSKDELGQLAEAFNAMAKKLREYRRSDRAKLFRTQRTTQLALNSFPDAVAIIGLDGKVELANDAAQERFGLRPGADLAKANPKHLWDMFQKAFTTMLPVEPQGYQDAIQIFDGSNETFFLPRLVPIVTEDKSLAGVTLVLADITNLRRLDEMKSGLLAVVSHELKTPLTSLRMATYLLATERLGPLSPKQMELVTTASEDAERLNKIIDNLLEIGRLSEGGELIGLEAAKGETLVAEATEAFLAPARDKGIHLRTSLDDNLPRVLVDRGRIGHVFSNLLGNALKYTPPGGDVTIAACQDGNYVIFRVTDTGIGIPEAYHAKVFERFFRVPGASEESGAGLGLAIAREIIEAHGGKLWLEESRPNKGSTFAFTVKAEPSAAEIPA